MARLADEWVKLAYWLPISWESYLKLPLHVRYAMFDSLNEIRKEAQTITGSSREDRRHGLE